MSSIRVYKVIIQLQNILLNNDKYTHNNNCYLFNNKKSALNFAFMKTHQFVLKAQPENVHKLKINKKGYYYIQGGYGTINDFSVYLIKSTINLTS